MTLDDYQDLHRIINYVVAAFNVNTQNIEPDKVKL